MNPFEQPPLGTPVSYEPPAPQPSGPGRGRMALVAIVTLGFVGAGIAGISQLASADRAELAVSATDDPTNETLPPADDIDDGATDESGAETGDESEDPADPPDPVVGAEGQIVLETDDGDPIVIDLGELAGGELGELTECIGLPMFDFDFGFGEGVPGEFPIGDLDEFFEDLPFDLDALEDFDFGSGGFGEFGGFDIDGGSVTVAGPDGVSVIDLGENGSVTITKNDGELTISTEGDATVGDLADLFGEFGTIFDGEFDLGELDLGELDLGEFGFEDLPAFDPIDPEQVQSCLDEVLGG